jgi:peptidoglycan/xylan/chitin deacetylase (PgdA/CDA1 family)
MNNGMRPCIALKVDVDTWRGTRHGVPALAALFKKYQAPATFLFSLGPDRTGRAITRVFKPGFFQKVARTSVVEHYGIKTLLYGTVLPSPDIGRREAATLRAVRDAGFEVGIHCWEHIAWQDKVRGAPADWTLAQLERAATRFNEIFDAAPTTHGAAGWQTNATALHWLDAHKITHASDGRGHTPFRPVVEGRTLSHIQLPTNLPTLDEVIGLDGVTADNVHAHILNITADPTNSRYPDGSFVYTLHAELEGMRLLPVMDKLLQGWHGQGYRFSDLQQMVYAFREPIPPGTAEWRSIDGRSGDLWVQTNDQEQG